MRETGTRDADRDPPVTLALVGDVMTARGIDQILPHPCDPTLHEPYVTSALDYVEMAERRNGPVPCPASFAYPWGDALDELERRQPQLRIINLETAVTRSDRPAPKGIHYRMSPGNAPVLTAAGIHACSLANNHVLDWGEAGLLETIETLETLGISPAGAGRNRTAAEAPRVLTLDHPSRGDGRVLLFARCFPTSGVPKNWAATEDRPGVAYLPRPSRTQADRLAEQVRGFRKPGDLVVVSLHWGPNWGYEVSGRERAFAHRLIDRGGADIVHGHSSHHPRPMEVYRERLILYGSGDFLNDYEGIRGHEALRPELVLLYLATLRPGDGALLDLTMVPFRICRFRLERASGEDPAWLARTLEREGAALGTSLEHVEGDGGPELRWK